MLEPPTSHWRGMIRGWRSCSTIEKDPNKAAVKDKASKIQHVPAQQCTVTVKSVTFYYQIHGRNINWMPFEVHGWRCLNCKQFEFTFFTEICMLLHQIKALFILQSTFLFVFILKTCCHAMVKANYLIYETRKICFYSY